MRGKLRILKSIMSVMLCITLVISCFPEAEFVAVAEEIEEIVTREVSTEEQFMEALDDVTVDVIQLTDDITLSRSQDGLDNVFVINRSVTICGGGLILERTGIILGGAVTFENMEIYFTSAVRNAIIANGYPLTINNVSTGGSAYNIDIFCGGITDYNGGNTNEIPMSGTEGSVTIKGTNTLTGEKAELSGGNIYAGSLSDVGDGVADSPNVYSGNVNITIEKEASGVGEIYAHGARENRQGGYANQWMADEEKYKVTGDVNVFLKTCTNVIVHGATGGTKNAAFLYKDDGNGYVCSPVLENVNSIALQLSSDGAKTNLAPVISDANSCVFDSLSVPSNTRLSFVNMGGNISVASFSGGGEIILKEKDQNLEITGTVSGFTKLAVKEISFDNVNSMGSIGVGCTYVTVINSANISEEYGFEILPNSWSPNVVIADDGTGNWITELQESNIVISEIKDVSDAEISKEETYYYVQVPIAITYENPESEYNFLSDIPMFIYVNGKETTREIAASGYGYDYLTGTTDDDLLMWFENSDVNNEILYIGSAGDSDYVSAGRYEIAITIPAKYMANKEVRTLQFVVIVKCNENEHTGGHATCTERAICEICGESYGTVDNTAHTGGVATCTEKAKCQRCGVSYGELNSSNHAGGTEIRNAKAATETEKGYTGDTYCLGCNVKITDGKELPVIPKEEEEETEISIAQAAVTLSATSFTYNGTEKKPKVTVKFGNKKLREGTDYTVSYKNNKKIGKASVIITGIGNYTDTITKTFTIKVEKGHTFTSGKYKYKVTGSSTVAFNGIKSTKTTSVTIPKTVKYGGKTFKVTSIANSALKKKTKVTSVKIGANVKTIGVSAFEGCKKLRKVTFGSAVTTIEDKAFKNCTALKSITIPSKVKKIDKQAFYGCKNLKTINIKSTKLQTVGKDAFKKINSKATIKVPKKKLKTYKKLLKNKGQGSKVKIVKY